jgi:hypothetical protein
MSIEDLSDEELDAVFFEMAIDNNIDLLDESIIELEKKESLTEDERINLENKKQQLVNLVKIKKNGKQQN